MLENIKNKSKVVQYWLKKNVGLSHRVLFFFFSRKAEKIVFEMLVLSSDLWGACREGQPQHFVVAIPFLDTMGV